MRGALFFNAILAKYTEEEMRDSLSILTTFSAAAWPDHRLSQKKVDTTEEGGFEPEND